MTETQVKVIEKILSKGDRVEIIPGKENITILRIRREKVKIENGSPS